MSAMFAFCFKLNNLNIKNFKTKNVTDMSFMFAGCSNLIDLDISNFNIENVQFSKNMFYKCNIVDKIKTLNNFEKFKNDC